MQGTQHDDSANRPISSHGHRKPDQRMVASLLALRIAELPASSVRRQTIEQMIAGMQD